MAGIFVLALTLGGWRVQGQGFTPMPEYGAKAMYLTALASRYTTWPASSFASDTSPIIIGILGDDPFGELLDQRAAEATGRRPIRVRRLLKPSEAIGCHLVFIARSERRTEAEWLAALKGRPILTVGESGETIARGGILQFVLLRDRVGFDVSVRAMADAGVRLNADALAHAKRVFR